MHRLTLGQTWPTLRSPSDLRFDPSAHAVCHCWRKSSKDVTASWPVNWAWGFSLPPLFLRYGFHLPFPLLEVAPGTSLEIGMWCWKHPHGIYDCTSLGPLVQCLRFGREGAEIHESCCYPRRGLLCNLPLLVKTATYQPGVGCLFLQSPLAFRIQGPVSDYTQEVPEEVTNRYPTEKTLRSWPLCSVSFGDDINGVASLFNVLAQASEAILRKLLHVSPGTAWASLRSSSFVLRITTSASQALSF